VLHVQRDPGAGPLPRFVKRAAADAPCIQFDTILLDRGDIPVVGEPVPFVFTFRNLGVQDLVIQAVHTDCKCLQSEKPAQAVPPGGMGEIRLLYRVEGARGTFNHAAVVETNDPAFPVIKVTALGNTATGVQVTPSRLSLGEVVAGQRSLVPCFVRYEGEAGNFVVLKAESDMRGAEVSIYPADDRATARPWWPEGHEPGNSSGVVVVELAIVPPEGIAGKIEGTLAVFTSIPRYEKLTVPVGGQAVLPVRACPSLLSFGEVLPDESVRRTIKIVAEPARRFRVVGIEPSPAGLEAALPAGTAGREAEIVFRTDGATACRVSGTTLHVVVEIEGAKQPLRVPLPVHAWRRGARTQ